jgi:hypothetical protein
MGFMVDATGENRIKVWGSWWKRQVNRIKVWGSQWMRQQVLVLPMRQQVLVLPMIFLCSVSLFAQLFSEIANIIFFWLPYKWQAPKRSHQIKIKATPNVNGLDFG